MIYKPKLKLLFMSEASYSNTGNARTYFNILNRLYATNKYRIAELGSFGEIGNPADSIIKWKLY